MKRFYFPLLLLTVVGATAAIVVTLDREPVITMQDEPMPQARTNAENPSSQSPGILKRWSVPVEMTESSDEIEVAHRPGTLVRYMPKPGPPIRPVRPARPEAQATAQTAPVIITGTGPQDDRLGARPVIAGQRPPVHLPDRTRSNTRAFTKPASPGRSTRRTGFATRVTASLPGASPSREADSPPVITASHRGGGSLPPAPAHVDALSISLIPDTRSAASGETVRLDVLIDGAHDVVDIPFTLAYDPAAFEYVGSTEGTFLNRNGDSTVFVASNNPTSGKISFGLSRYLREKGADGDGLLATVELRLRGEGSGSIDFDRGAVRDGTGSFLHADFRGTVVETIGGD